MNSRNLYKEELIQSIYQAVTISNEKKRKTVIAIKQQDIIDDAIFEIAFNAINAKDKKILQALSLSLPLIRFAYFTGMYKGESVTSMVPSFFSSIGFYKACKKIAYLGNEESIRFLFENFNINPNAIIYGAAQGNHLDLLNELLNINSDLYILSHESIILKNQPTDKNTSFFYSLINKHSIWDCAVVGAAHGENVDLINSLLLKGGSLVEVKNLFLRFRSDFLKMLTPEEKKSIHEQAVAEKIINNRIDKNEKSDLLVHSFLTTNSVSKESEVKMMELKSPYLS